MKELLKHSKVFFNNPNNVYKPGDILNGRVEFNFSCPKTVRGIFITISGKAYVNWEEESTTDDNKDTTKLIKYTNSETYFKEKIYVTGDEKDTKIELPAGKYVYPFQFLLPSNLPPSYGDNKSIGKIIYKVKATLDKPWKINKYVEKPFIVETSTIQDNPQIEEPQIMKLEKQFGLIFNSKWLTVTVKTPKSGFRAGEIINLTLDVDNRSDTAIKSISIKLKEISKFHATEKTRTDEKTLSKNHISFPVGPNTTTTFSHTLSVPNDLVPRDLTNCNIIDITYGIQVELHLAGLTKNIVGTMTMIPIRA